MHFRSVYSFLNIKFQIIDFHSEQHIILTCKIAKDKVYCHIIIHSSIIILISKYNTVIIYNSELVLNFYLILVVKILVNLYVINRY